MLRPSAQLAQLANPSHWGPCSGVLLHVLEHAQSTFSAKNQEPPQSEDLEPDATPQQHLQDLMVVDNMGRGEI